MKVLVINTNRERSPHTLVPLGACMVASAALDAGHGVRFLDLTFSRSPERAAANAVREQRPRVIALSIRNIDNCDAARPRFFLDDTRNIVRACREAGAETIVLGGSAVTCAPEAVLKYVGGDFVVAGEGEVAFPALLERLDAGDDTTTGRASPIHDLSSLPDVRLDRWLNIRRYLACDASFPVQTKRGCPFDCSYCLYPKIEGRCLRLRDPEAVAADVVQASKLGFRSAEIVDSVFGVPQDHSIACCEAVARLNDGVSLQCVDVNPLGCTREVVSAMSAAGFSVVGCTVESASDTVLASLGKGFSRDAVIRAAEELTKLDALKLWILMLGAPGESETTVADTADFLGRCLGSRDLVYVTCGIRILPGTRLHERAVEEGVVSTDDDLLRPKFYFSPEISPERAMAIIHKSGFPGSNIITQTDGNDRLLPYLQRAAHAVGIAPPYWRFAPAWNRLRRAFRGGNAGI